MSNTVIEPDVPQSDLATVEITPRAAASAGQGNLWIFSNEVIKKPEGATPGLWCRFAHRGKTVAYGYFNPHSLIAGRVLGWVPPPVRADLLEHRIEQSFRRRPAVGPEEAARLVFSEADIIPGLVIDVFADRAVVQSNTAGMDAALPDIETIVPRVFERVFNRPLRALVLRGDSGIRRLEQVEDFVRIVKGDEAELTGVTFREEGVAFVANLVGGQKTGSFLDQRDNRTAFAARMAGQSKAKVLDLFCYAGAWGLRALAAGVEQVTFVDESAEALALVEKALALNSIAPSRARLVRSEAFAYLEKEQSSYEAVVCDPPAFVKSKKNLSAAKRAYERLNRAAWPCVKRGGLLMTSSCSYHLSEADFDDALINAIGRERGIAQIVYRGGQAADHPVLLSMPETRYLKCLGLRRLVVER